jgi:hypothetical protein
VTGPGGVLVGAYHRGVHSDRPLATFVGIGVEPQRLGERKSDRKIFCGSVSYRRDAVRGGVEGGHRDRPHLRRTEMTHYLLAVHGPAEMGEFGNYGSKEEMEEAFAATGAFNDKLHAAGYWVFAGGLAPASTATVVDGQSETPVMTDGPYLETKEVIGGFWVIDAPDLDVALKLAAEGSKACRGKVEVRPFDGLA